MWAPPLPDQTATSRPSPIHAEAESHASLTVEPERSSPSYQTREGGNDSEPARVGVVKLPNDLEIVLTREFDAPIEPVFDVMTKPEHGRKTIAPFGEDVTVCSIHLRIAGNYHFVFVTDAGIECSFRGTYLANEPPTRTVETWRFDGWPQVEAVESMDLREAEGVTTLTRKLAFRDRAGRDHMNTFDGIEGNFDNVEDLLRSLLEAQATVSNDG